MSKQKKILGLIFLLVCIIATIAVNYYPVGDWVSAPLITWFIMLPVIAIEVVLLLVLFNTKRTKLILSVQGVLAVLCLLVMVYYIVVH